MHFKSYKHNVNIMMRLVLYNVLLLAYNNTLKNIYTFLN